MAINILLPLLLVTARKVINIRLLESLILQLGWLQEALIFADRRGTDCTSLETMAAGNDNKTKWLPLQAR